MTILPTEKVIEFSHNLQPSAFDSMKRDLRLFGPRSARALETDLTSRLDQLVDEHSIERILRRLIAGLCDYRNTIYENLRRFLKSPTAFSADDNIDAFWRLMNSFLIDIVDPPRGVDAILLKDSAPDLLAPYFNRIDHIVEFRLQSLMADWFGYFAVTLARLEARNDIQETLFGHDLSYRLERISTLTESIIFGVQSFFDPKTTTIRVDARTVAEAVDSDSLAFERELVQSKNPYTTYQELLLDHVLFHEKAHLLFHRVVEAHYRDHLKQHRFVLTYAVLSEVWARLSTLYLFNGSVLYELEQVSGLAHSPNPVYRGTFEFLRDNTQVFDVTDADPEERIYEARASSFGGLLTTVNWMREKLGHLPSESWLPLFQQMERAYDAGGIGPNELAEYYCPNLD